jgi:addiction module RelE/StbE family toxin
MGQVIWAPSATKDVEDIAEYIARDSPDQAALFVTRVLEATDRLADFPLSGRIIPEMSDVRRREIIAGSFRIMYRIEEGAVWVIAVVHGAREWKKPKR